VSGYMVFYPINYIGHFGEFMIHYHSDVGYCYTVSKNFNAKIFITPNIVANIDDSNKVFMKKMRIKEYLYDVKSPYEYKSNIYYFLLISKNINMFLKLMTKYFYRLIRLKLFYTIKFWSK